MARPVRPARDTPRVTPSRTVIAHLDLDAFYASVELLRRPELRGQPVIVVGLGAAGGRHHRLLRGAQVRRRLGDARRRARGGCARRRSSSRPDFAAYREVRAGDGALVRATSRASSRSGLDEAYLDLTGLLSPQGGDAAARRRDQAATGLTASVGIGPNKLVAKVASDAEKPHGLVALTRELACERFADAPPRPASPASARRRPSGCERWASPRSARCGRRRAEALPGASAPTTARDLLRRAHFEGDASVDAERDAVSRVERDDVRHRRRRPRRAGAPCSRRLADAALRAASAQARAPRAARSRSRCGSTTSRRSRARARSTATTNDAEIVGGVARDAAARLRARRGRCACSACASRRSRTRTSPRRPTTGRNSGSPSESGQRPGYLVDRIVSTP